MDRNAPILPVVEAWLQQKRTTLFGQAFDLSQNPEAAARWFTEQVDDFLTFAEAYERNHS